MSKLLSLLLAAIPMLAAAGCATPGSVDALDPRLKELYEKTSKIEGKVNAMEEGVKKLDKLSNEMTKKAEAAAKKSQKEE